MVRRGVAVATTLALALAAAPVRAQEPAPPAAYDTVVLRDGSVLRGTILELHPGREVVLSLAGGTRTIAWSDVASTALAGAVMSSETGANGHDPKTILKEPGEGPPIDEDEVAPGPSRPRIFIELTRPGDVHLLEIGAPPAATSSRVVRGGYHVASRSVCRAPCGRVIDGRAGYPFYFGGAGVMPSRPFFLRDLEGEYVARVRPGRLSLLAGGVVTIGLGYGGTLSGGLLLGISRDSEVRIAGGVVLGVGLALLVAGVTMAVRSATRYRLEKRR